MWGRVCQRALQHASPDRTPDLAALPNQNNALHFGTKPTYGVGWGRGMGIILGCCVCVCVCVRERERARGSTCELLAASRDMHV